MRTLVSQMSHAIRYFVLLLAIAGSVAGQAKVDTPPPVATVVPPVSKGLLEVGAFPGMTLSSEGVRPMIGGTASYQISRRFAPYVEASHFPSLDRIEAKSQTQVLRGSPPAVEFHGGTHFLIRNRRSRLVPYFSAGGGYFRYLSGQGELSSSLGLLPPRPQPFTADGALAFNVGAGGRWYSTRRWGLRAEIKYYRLTGLANNANVLKITLGAFAHFRPRGN